MNNTTLFSAFRKLLFLCPLLILPIIRAQDIILMQENTHIRMRVAQSEQEKVKQEVYIKKKEYYQTIIKDSLQTLIEEKEKFPIIVAANWLANFALIEAETFKDREKKEIKINEAMTYFQYTLNLDPLNETALYNIGFNRFSNGCYQEAHQCFINLLHCSKKADIILSASTFLGKMYFKGLGVEKNFEEAKIFFSIATLTSEQGNLASWINLGLACKALSENKDAYMCFMKALKCDQNNTKANYFLGLCLVEGKAVKQDLERAFEIFSKTVDEEPLFARGHLALGQTCILIERRKEFPKFSEAKKHLKRAVKLDDSLLPIVKDELKGIESDVEDELKDIESDSV